MDTHGASANSFPPQPTPHVLVELWEDLVCPWCYIGRWRLHRAVLAFEHPPAVSIRSRPYELAPHLPRGWARPVPEWLAGWGLSDDQVRRRIELAERIARAENLGIDLIKAIAANTFDAHRLVELGWQSGGPPLQSAVVDRLFSAHFVEGLAIDDPHVLFRLGSEAGLEPSTLPRFLQGQELAEDVRQGEQIARDLQINAVPCFVVERRLALQGAESVEVLLAFLRSAYEEASRGGDLV